MTKAEVSSSSWASSTVTRIGVPLWNFGQGGYDRTDQADQLSIGATDPLFKCT